MLLTMKLGEGKELVNLSYHWGSVFYLVTLAKVYWKESDGEFMPWVKELMNKDYGETIAVFINKFGDRITIFDDEEEYKEASSKTNLIENTP